MLKALQAAQGLIIDPVSVALTCDMLDSTLPFSLLLNILICSLKKQRGRSSIVKGRKEIFFFSVRQSESVSIFPGISQIAKWSPDLASCSELSGCRGKRLTCCTRGCSHHTHFQRDFFTNTYKYNPSLSPLVGGTHTPSNPSVQVLGCVWKSWGVD